MNARIGQPLHSAPPATRERPRSTRLGLRTKLYANAGLLVASLGLVAAIAAYGGHKNVEGLTEMLQYSQVMRDQMEVDMMHDALRADVLDAIVADDAHREEVRQTLETHIERIQGVARGMEGDSVPADIKAEFEKVRQPVQDYIAAARAQVDTSGRDKDAARATLPRFMEQFEHLEGSLEGFGDVVERRVAEEQALSVATVEDVAHSVEAIALLAALLGGAACVTLARGLAARIDRIVVGIDGFAAGDCTTPVEIQGDDEIAAMARSLGECIRNTGTAIRGVAAGAAALSTNASGLASVAQTTNNEIEKMGTQLQGASVGAAQVSSNVQAVAGGMDEMSAAMHEISRNAVQAARVASTAVASAQGTSAAVARLGESGAEIGKFVKVISTIANQTNLLALNAAIEAARAGEAGRGFAVVANEVKELARETARATDDISRKIEAIQADTRTAVETNDQIATVIGQINDLQTAIAGAVEEQTATGNEIARNLQEAARASSVVANAIGVVAHSASATNAGAADAERATTRLASLAVDLESMCGRFTT